MSIARRFGPRCHCCPCSRRCRPATECLPPMLLAGSGRGGGKLTKSKLNIICCRNHSLEVCNSHRAVGGPTRWSQSDAMASYCRPDFIDRPRSCYQQASRVCSGRSRLQSPPAHSILLSGPRPLWRSVELWRRAPSWVLPFARSGRRVSAATEAIPITVAAIAIAEPGDRMPSPRVAFASLPSLRHP